MSKLEGCSSLPRETLCEPLGALTGTFNVLGMTILALGRSAFFPPFLVVLAELFSLDPSGVCLNIFSGSLPFLGCYLY